MKKQTKKKAKKEVPASDKKVDNDNSRDQIEHNITGGVREVYHCSMEDGRCSGSVGSGGLCG